MCELIWIGTSAFEYIRKLINFIGGKVKAIPLNSTFHRTDNILRQSLEKSVDYNSMTILHTPRQNKYILFLHSPYCRTNKSIIPNLWL